MNNYSTRWILQRITAFILIPLSFWFIYNCITFKDYEYVEFKFFFQSYINSFLFLIMMFAMLIHAKLGCETVVTDYVSRKFLKIILKVLINFITIMSLLFVILALIKLSII